MKKTIIQVKQVIFFYGAMFNDRLIRTWELIEDLQASLIGVEFSLSLSHFMKKNL